MFDTDSNTAIGTAKGSPRRAWALGFLAAIATLALVFLKLASEVGEGDSLSLDRTILLALRVPGHVGTPRGPAWLRESVTDLSSLGSPTVLTLLVLLACGYLVSRRRSTLAAVTLVIIGSGGLVANFIKTWFGRVRPEVVPHLVPAYSLSFPSGHAADSSMVYLTLAMLITSVEKCQSTRIFLLAAATALTVMIGLTRLYLGVHWPSDVLAGWIFGSCWALIGHLVITVFRRRADTMAFFKV